MVCLRIAGLALIASSLSTHAIRLGDTTAEAPAQLLTPAEGVAPVASQAAKKSAPPEHVHQYREIKLQGKYYPLRITGAGGLENTVNVRITFTPLGLQEWQDVPVEKMRPISPRQYVAATQQLKFDENAKFQVPVLMRNAIQDAKIPDSEKEKRKARVDLMQRRSANTSQIAENVEN